ncbi:MAG TPA: hypothetical protein VEI97_06845 [bacterium]|nr:hypothetical protein [bacterium]
MRNADDEAAGSLEDKKQDPWTEKDVRRLLKELDDSGEQVAPFARRRGFKPQRLHFWMSRLGWKRSKPLKSASPAKPVEAPAKPVGSPAKPAAPTFVPVRLVPDPRPAAGASRSRAAGVVVELGSRHIRVEADFDPDVLRKVVRVLEEGLPC